MIILENISLIHLFSVSSLRTGKIIFLMKMNSLDIFVFLKYSIKFVLRPYNLIIHSLQVIWELIVRHVFQLKKTPGGPVVITPTILMIFTRTKPNLAKTWQK